MSTKTMKTRTAARRILAALSATVALSAVTQTAQAQEILLTGPLAGAPAVRQMRLYREGRFEIAPAVSFTLLDEYQRTIVLGARLNYNFTDWLAIGAWGGVGSVVRLTTHLTDEIDKVNQKRAANWNQDPAAREPIEALNSQLTSVNLSHNGIAFKEQLAGIDWLVAPQVTLVPFRGKIALFQGIHIDTDLYFFGGPAFIGLTERADCGQGTDGPVDCSSDQAFGTASRVAIAPTFGLGLTFYINDWSALGFEYRALPFSWNAAGWDVSGGHKDNRFPDNKITNADRQFAFNQLLTISFNFYLPTQNRVSE